MSGARTIIDLQVSAPFHCSLMKPAAEVMSEALEDVSIKKPIIKFINNVSAEFIDEPAEIKKKLVEQVYKRVRWRESVINMISKGVDHFVEIGPGKVLSGLIKRIDRSVKIDTINNDIDIKEIKI